MKILALEFSSNSRSAAAVDNGRRCGWAQDSGPRGGRALGLVESAPGGAGMDEASAQGNTGGTVVGPDDCRWLQDAGNVFTDAVIGEQLAARRGDFVCGERVAGIYLRGIYFVKAVPP